MSVLILSLFNGILLFRQRTEQSVLYHVCPDAEGLGGTLNSALLKVGLAEGMCGECPDRQPVPYLEYLEQPVDVFQRVRFPGTRAEKDVLFGGGLSEHLVQETVLLLHVPVGLDQAVFLCFLLDAGHGAFS